MAIKETQDESDQKDDSISNLAQTKGNSLVPIVEDYDDPNDLLKDADQLTAHRPKLSPQTNNAIAPQQNQRNRLSHQNHDKI